MVYIAAHVQLNKTMTFQLPDGQKSEEQSKVITNIVKSHFNAREQDVKVSILGVTEEINETEEEFTYWGS